MWDINLKATEKQDKQKEAHGRGLQTSDYQKVGSGGREEVDGVKEVKYVVTERNLTMGSEYTV